MPFKGPPVCLKCETNESPMWTNAENLGAICLNCVNETKQNLKTEMEDEEEDTTQKPKRKPRNTRSYKTRLNPLAVPKAAAPKGRGRRGLFKRVPVKAPTATATPVTSKHVFYKGSYIQVGDIVSLRDAEGDVYYAQITGLLTDQYCQKSAVITWLLPTQESPPPNEGFDPATYIIGLEEEVPRDLDCMEFVMHAPSDYYKSKSTPYPSIYAPAQPGYIWSTMETIQRFTNGTPEDVEEEEAKLNTDVESAENDVKDDDGDEDEKDNEGAEDETKDKTVEISDEKMSEDDVVEVEDGEQSNKNEEEVKSEGNEDDIKMEDVE